MDCRPDAGLVVPGPYPLQRRGRSGLGRIQELCRHPSRGLDLDIAQGDGLRVLLALLLATLLNQKLPFLSLWRTIYYLPVVTSGVAVALMWMWIFQPNFGLVNNILWDLFRIKGPSWFFDKNWVLITFIITSTWSVGGPMLIYLAALQGVPTALYEAAKIDGAGAVRSLRPPT
jgi:multiple sugar transport system permease protein